MALGFLKTRLSTPSVHGLTFDPKTELHTGDHAEAANALLKDPNNKGFEVPTYR